MCGITKWSKFVLPSYGRVDFAFDDKVTSESLLYSNEGNEVDTGPSVIVYMETSSNSLNRTTLKILTLDNRKIHRIKGLGDFSLSI